MPVVLLPGPHNLLKGTAKANTTQGSPAPRANGPGRTGTNCKGRTNPPSPSLGPRCRVGQQRKLQRSGVSLDPSPFHRFVPDCSPAGVRNCASGTFHASGVGTLLAFPASLRSCVLLELQPAGCMALATILGDHATTRPTRSFLVRVRCWWATPSGSIYPHRRQDGTSPMSKSLSVHATPLCLREALS